ncbi:MAG: hypothetical protein ACRDRZ_14070 [Pseudonocardiaceae bacterium]
MPERIATAQRQQHPVAGPDPVRCPIDRNPLREVPGKTRPVLTCPRCGHALIAGR